MSLLQTQSGAHHSSVNKGGSLHWRGGTRPCTHTHTHTRRINVNTSRPCLHSFPHPGWFIAANLLLLKTKTNDSRWCFFYPSICRGRCRRRPHRCKVLSALDAGLRGRQSAVACCFSWTLQQGRRRKVSTAGGAAALTQSRAKLVLRSSASPLVQTEGPWRAQSGRGRG